jgi:FeS assembly SUF system protein
MGDEAHMPKPLEVEESLPKLGLTSIQKSLFEAEVIEQIRTVYDPEIPVNVYDLGLIYDVQVDDSKNTHIVMTLTSPMCPVAGSLPGEVECAVRGTHGIGDVTVELTWDPPFTIERMSDEVRLMLGID